MNDQTDFESLQSYLEKIARPITDDLKAISFPIRFQILLSLLPKDKTFGNLMEITELKKSALAKHLNILVENLLIEKTHHGNYQITQKGKYYLRALKEANENIDQGETMNSQFVSSKAFFDFHK